MLNYLVILTFYAVL